MDWYKSKTILIIALLITNLILLGIYFSKTAKVDESLSPAFIKETERVLDVAGIKLDVEIPKEEPGMVTPFARTVVFKIQELNDSFFDGKGEVSIRGDDSFEILYRDGRLELYEGRRFVYWNYLNNSSAIDSLEGAKDYAMAYLEERNFLSEATKLEYAYEKNGEYYLFFANLQEGNYVEECDMILVLDKEGLVKMEKEWIELEEAGVEKTFISPAPKALRALASKDELRGKTIISIDLCFYLPSGINEEEETGREVRGKTLPAWRVLFNDGTKIILSDN
ncbi:MAG: hypothetical protein GX219_09345 [Tissierellia bacterium]|nr:hypothetical protein [Tissierellia bacterium]